MLAAEAQALATQMSQSAPAGVHYEMAETSPAKGDISPFYVRRVAVRGAHGDEQPETDTTPVDAQMSL